MRSSLIARMINAVALSTLVHTTQGDANQSARWPRSSTICIAPSPTTRQAMPT